MYISIHKKFSKKFMGFKMIADLWWKGKKDVKTSVVIEKVKIVLEANQKSVMSRWILSGIKYFMKVL